MRGHGAWLGLVVVLAILAGGLAMLFQWRLAQGDVFPPYSSLRSDPLGLRGLHDALSEIPGRRVERWHQPYEDLPPLPPRTLVYAGWPARGWKQVRREDFDAADAVIRSGSRVVIAMRAEAASLEPKPPMKDGKNSKKGAKEEKTDRKEPAPVAYADLQRRWGADVKQRVLLERRGGAVATELATSAGLPSQIPWQSDVYFQLEPEAGWRVLYRRAGQPVLVERALGRGSLVLAADSYFLSNEALQKDRAPALLAWVIGSHARIVFDETHHGVLAQPGVAALARRYGLWGAFCTLLLLAALFVWRRMALFVPPSDAPPELGLTYHPAAGLEALLSRSVAPADLPRVCAEEWRPTARAGDRARIDEVFVAAPAKASPVDLYNAAVRALQRH